MISGIADNGSARQDGCRNYRPVSISKLAATDTDARPPLSVYEYTSRWPVTDVLIRYRLVHAVI